MSSSDTRARVPLCRRGNGPKEDTEAKDVALFASNLERMAARPCLFFQMHILRGGVRGMGV